jgi:hypothetical protein
MVKKIFMRIICPTQFILPESNYCLSYPHKSFRSLDNRVDEKEAFTSQGVNWVNWVRFIFLFFFKQGKNGTDKMNPSRFAVDFYLLESGR